MNSPAPINELDQAILALRRSQAALPDFCRSLCKGELFLLIRYQPDLVDATLEIKNGAPFPFALLQTEQGETVPVYTSVERANEGLAKCQVPSMQFVIGSMPALQALEVVGKMNFSMTLNKGCSTGEIALPANMLRDLADGTAFRPRPGKGGEFTLQLVAPQDFPTDIVQAAFELFRKHAGFKAAWLFTRGDEPGAYFLIAIMQPRDETLLHDLRLIVQSAGGKDHPVYAEALAETATEQIANLFQCGRPFYQAADYSPPAGTQPATEDNP